MNAKGKNQDPEGKQGSIRMSSVHDYLQAPGRVLGSSYPAVAAWCCPRRPLPVPQPPCLPAPRLTREVESQMASFSVHPGG